MHSLCPFAHCSHTLALITTTSPLFSLGHCYSIPLDNCLGRFSTRSRWANRSRTLAFSSFLHFRHCPSAALSTAALRLQGTLVPPWGPVFGQLVRPVPFRLQSPLWLLTSAGLRTGLPGSALRAGQGTAIAKGTISTLFLRLSRPFSVASAAALDDDARYKAKADTDTERRQPTAITTALHLRS